MAGVEPPRVCGGATAAELPADAADLSLHARCDAFFPLCVHHVMLQVYRECVRYYATERACRLYLNCCCRVLTTIDKHAVALHVLSETRVQGIERGEAVPQLTKVAEALEKSSEKVTSASA